jgi:hypothetical protein
MIRKPEDLPEACFVALRGQGPTAKPEWFALFSPSVSREIYAKITEQGRSWSCIHPTGNDRC